MKVLHISTRLILGGSQENTVLSCEGQSRLGHEVHLAYGPIFGPEGSMLERVKRFRTADGRGITTHEVPSLVREINPIKDRLCAKELHRLIVKLRPDIVHTHSSKAGIIGRKAAWEAGRAAPRDPSGWREGGCEWGVVHTVHGPPFMPVEGSALRRLKTLIINRAYVGAERYAAHRCHAIVSVANAMTELFLSKGIGEREQYATVYSGMETERFLTAAPGEDRESMRRELGLANHDMVVGTVARLAEHKGHDDVLDALGPDLKSRPSLKLLWVGDGWWRERLVQKARSLGLKVSELDGNPAPRNAQVVLTGLAPTERVAGHIRAMDILAHPSYREGLPRTVPQALLCGVVPVAYDVDGTREACMDGSTGRLVAPGDRRGLRDAVMGLADSPNERKRLAEAGRDLCRERFSAEAMVKELERVYERATRLARGESPATRPAPGTIHV